jgi:hypothetical protein
VHSCCSFSGVKWGGGEGCEQDCRFASCAKHPYTGPDSACSIILCILTDYLMYVPLCHWHLIPKYKQLIWYTLKRWLLIIRVKCTVTPKKSFRSFPWRHGRTRCYHSTVSISKTQCHRVTRMAMTPSMFLATRYGQHTVVAQNSKCKISLKCSRKGVGLYHTYNVRQQRREHHTTFVPWTYD